MRNLVVLVFCTVSTVLFCQIKFEPGYIIDDTGTQTTCLIKYEEWKNNPSTFTYKLSENDKNITGDINSIKEFGIDNLVKFIRQEVDMDVSSIVQANFTTNPEPIFKKQRHFIKVLVEGDASLFEFADGQNKKYFYSYGDFEFRPLIYKKYIINGDKIAANNRYKMELYENLKCNSITQDDAKKLNYRKGSLISFFEQYNQCVNSESVVFEKKNKGDFNLTIRPGVTFSSFWMGNSSFQADDVRRSVDFEDKVGFRIGLEIEYILPINRNKWSVFFEPTYFSYKSDIVIPQNPLYENVDRTFSMNYSVIDLPIGIRYYMFLGDDFKLFIDGAAIPSITVGDNKIDLKSVNATGSETKYDMTIGTIINAGFGVGLKYDRYSLQFRYHTPRNLLKDYVAWDSKLKSISIIAGITLF